MSQRIRRFGLTMVVTTLAVLVVAIHSTFASSTGRVAAGIVPNLPHKIQEVGVVIEPPTVNSVRTRNEAIKAASKLIPPSVINSNAALVAVNYVTYRDQGEFSGGIPAWIVSYQVNIPKISGVPGDGVHPSVTNYGHADSMDVLVADVTGEPIQNFVHGVWDKTVVCDKNGNCTTQFH